MNDGGYGDESISSEARVDFRFLMPVDGDSVVLVVLDRDCDWGDVATVFARAARQVIALGTNLDSLRSVQLRAQN